MIWPSLRVHEDSQEEYLVLKQRLASLYPDDRHSHTAEKAEFIGRVLRQARKSYP